MRKRHRHYNVSIVFCVLPQPDLLAAALESVVSQSFRPVEMLVVDAKSIDKTVAIVHTFPLTRLISDRPRVE